MRPRTPPRDRKKRAAKPLPPPGEQGCYNLKAQPTRLLLQWKRKAYRCWGGAPNPHAGYDPTECGGNISVADLKAELATRPHVPNKVESREARRLRQKQGRAR
jgi:hypothetical protein